METDFPRLCDPPVFSDKQFRKLADHLSIEFSEYGEGIAEAFELDADAYLRWLDDNAATADELKTWRKHYQDQARAIWTVIMGLHDPSMRGMRDIPEEALLYRYYDCMNAVKDHTRGKGAPKNTGRAVLIQKIRNTYGHSRAKLSRDSHFEKTIGLILEIMDGPQKDIHKTILNALKVDTSLMHL